MAGSFKLLKNKGGYKIKKWLIAASVAVLMAFNFDANAQATYADINIGDYIDGFGGIKWRVINKTADGLLVRTDRALTRAQMAGYSGVHATADIARFSAARTGHTNANTDRDEYGTNRWHETEIRAWLNGFEWVNNTPQTTSFIGKFNDDELAAIVSVEQIQHLWTGDETEESDFAARFDMPTPTGSGAVTYTTAIANVVPTNYNTAHQTTISDKIFLLDIKQAYEISTVGGSDLENVNGLSYHIVSDAAGTNVISWLRTPYRQYYQLYEKKYS